jgi:ATP-dependent exoDNAse (exonuclease V) alpha subunit
VVIDEVSMLRADLLDCVDAFLRATRRRPGEAFGGVKMIFVGDLYQLPPVLASAEQAEFLKAYPSPYFFDALVMKHVAFECVTLEKIFRQSDGRFIAALNAIRNNAVDEEHLACLNARAGFDPAPFSDDELAVFLAATNQRASEINRVRLASLADKARLYRAHVGKDFDTGRFPTEESLTLKRDAQVMLLSNDPDGRWVNGTLGRITRLEADRVGVRLENSETVGVEPYTWHLHHYRYDASKRTLITESAGSFTQLPLRLAWALTIHKSQGKSFERVFLDLSRRIFAPGQLYVALSRCRSLSGLTLSRPLRKNDVFVDFRIVKFMTSWHYARSEAAMPLTDKMRFLESAIAEGKPVTITYLKASDEKSVRVVTPLSVGTMHYQGKPFTGMRALCALRREERVFRVDRILTLGDVQSQVESG